MALLVITVLLGVVEGLTEFVPVSSTGHLIIVDELLGFASRVGGKEAAECFEIIIQPAAILAVVVLYWPRFVGLIRPEGRTEGFYGTRGILLLAITTLPALIVGPVLHHLVPFQTGPVVFALALGAVGMIIIEWFRPKARVHNLDALTWREALITGMFQSLSAWPGLSRSAATIVGAMIGRVERKTAAEYSFLAAVPVMAAATVYKLVGAWSILSSNHLPYFVVGFVVSFVFAMLAVKGFIALLGRWTLVPFAVYRLLLAGVVYILLIR